MHTPFSRQQESRAAQHATNQIRNKLMLQARKLLASYHSVDRSDKGSLTHMLGALESYVALRQSIAPEVALDGYQGEIEGVISLLKLRLTEITPPLVNETANESDALPVFVVSVQVDAMNWYGEATPICRTYVSVAAASEVKASQAAVAFFGDGVTPVTHLGDSADQTLVEYEGSTGHTVWLRERAVRYTSVRLLKTSQEEMETFHCITTGLSNSKTIIG